MIDVQNQPDYRNITINRVGVSNIEYPVTIKSKTETQQTIGVISMGAGLSNELRGIHMSRFIEIINRHRLAIELTTIEKILEEIKSVLNSEHSYVSIKFKYFIEKTAPVSAVNSFMSYDCEYSGSSTGNTNDVMISVTAPVMSLCPCSKEISDYGAHNQRSKVSISARCNKLVHVEELIDYAEKSGSTSVYTLLKRTDEKFITEAAYNNPVFVEDIVRTAAQFLNNDSRIEWYEVTSVNMESIHNHDAWATIVRDKRNSN